MAEPKTRPTDASVPDFLAAVSPAARSADAVLLDEVMRAVSGERPVMWGASIVGYGERTYADSKGKPVVWPMVAFSPRKTEFVLYVHGDVEQPLLDALGPHRRGVGCVYLKRISGVDGDALRALIARSIELTRG